MLTGTQNKNKKGSDPKVGNKMSFEVLNFCQITHFGSIVSGLIVSLRKKKYILPNIGRSKIKRISFPVSSSRNNPSRK